MIDKFKRKRKIFQPYSINKIEYFCFKNTYLFFENHNYEYKVKGQIIKLSEKEMYRRTDLINLMKHLDQTRTLYKILLNKHQVFMLENKAKTIVYNKYSDDIDEGEKEMKELKVAELINYIKEKKETEKLNKDDYILLEVLDSEIKDEVLNKVEIEF